MPRSDDEPIENLREEHAALARELTRAIARLEKRVKAVTSDLAKIQEAEMIAARAPWLVAAAAKARRGAKSLAFSDWSSGTEEKIEMVLDPAKSAKEQVDTMFQRARRLRAGRPVAERRRDEATAVAEKLRALLAELQTLAPGAPELESALEEFHDRSKAIAPREIRADAPSTKKKLRERAPAYRAFVGHGAVKILVGRGAARNDELTFEVARPHHAWLHARAEAGAHVVVCIKKDGELTQEQLVDAAHLAAHFSKARGEGTVDVSYTYRRYVRKPRKSPPGMVMVDREKVIAVRLEPERLAKLLATEETGKVGL